ncbi:MAG: RDD family protein [Pseudonocardia sp.]
MPDLQPEPDPPRRDITSASRLPQYGFPLLATYGQRVGGFLIDIGIPGGLLAIVLIAALATKDVTVIGLVYPGAAVVGLVFLVWNSGYRQGRSGQSLGKSALGTRLVGMASGEPVGSARALGRQLLHLVDGIPLGLGFIWPLWDEQRQTFADKMCATMVVQADL